VVVLTVGVRRGKEAEWDGLWLYSSTPVGADQIARNNDGLTNSYDVHGNGCATTPIIRESTHLRLPSPSSNQAIQPS